MKPYIPTDELLRLHFYINGAETALDSLLKDALIMVEINKIAFAKFTFIDMDPIIPDNKPLPTDVFTKKQPKDALDILEVKVIYQKKMETLFKGYIKSVDKYLEDNLKVSKVECKDIAHQLTHPFKIENGQIKSFETKTLEEKNDFFAKKYNISIDNSLKGQPWGAELITYNNNAPPWDFMVSYLDSIGQFVVTRNGVLQGINIHQKPASEDFLAENGINIFSFSGKVDDSKRVSKVTLVSWDSDKQEQIETESKEGDGAKTGAPAEELKLNSVKYSDATKKLLVDTVVAKSDLAAIQGKVQTFGNLQGKCGGYIRFNKTNEELTNRLILITQEVHTIENGAWKTEYAFGVESNKSFSENIAARTTNTQAKLGSTNGVSGLQLGIVTDIEDPLGQCRVKVNLPVINTNGDGNWARLSSIFAGKDLGSLFVPEVGDEVVVGCLGGSPDHMIVLGSLYSSPKPPAKTITKDNYLKGFYSKTKLAFEMDDEKKAIQLKTEKGNKLLISEDEKGITLEDENQNKIRMDENGITLESAKDIILKAKNNISIEGIGINGNASGIMELKGSLIKLN